MMGQDVNNIDDVIFGFINLSAPHTPMDPFASILHDMIIPKGPNVNANLQLTLEQLYKGGTFEINYNIKVKTGNMRQTEINNFSPFGQFGQKTIIQVPEENIEPRITNINIPEGYDPTYPIIVKGIIPCNATRGRNGDLIVNISTIPHDTFKRDGYDLKIKLDISLKESLLGFDRKIKMLDDSLLELNCKSIVNPYDIKEINGAGMPIDSEKSGSLYIKFHIKFPTELTDEQKKMLEKL